MTAEPALAVRRLTKRFGGALALSDVSLDVARGEVHGLLGSNGSGKSTLIKVLSGFHAPEPGAGVSLYGRPVPLPISGARARALGLAFVHQNLGLIGSLSVAENLSLTRLAAETNWRLSWRALNTRAAEAFERYHLALDPRAPVATLSPVDQALLAIVRAAEDLAEATDAHAARPGVLVLDEPTPFLPRSGVDELFALVRRCVAGGASVIFVSHDVDEVRAITDRATILRDGKVAATVTTADTPHERFVEHIVGRRLEAYAGRAKSRPASAPTVRIERLQGARVGPASFALARGEILGLTGLIGSGFDDVAARLIGARQGTRGRLDLDGEAIDLAHIRPHDAVRHGIAYLPADRLGEAGVGSLPVADNIALPLYDRLAGRFGLTDRSVGAHASAQAKAANVKPNAPELPLAALSGGNAQKALVAKWLQTKPRLLLLDEPTQGVDVGARQAIWDALDAAAGEGAAILVASTDYEQLALICHRVLVFSRGSVVRELAGAALTKEAIATQCMSADRHAA